MQRILAKIRTYLYHNQMEYNGILAFAFLLILLFAILYVFDSQSEQNVNSEKFFARIDSLENLQVEETEGKAYFVFNPNTVSETDLQKLGFSEKQIRNLLNYRKAGGKFYKKQDFKKLYFVNDSIYEVYKAFIVTPKQVNLKKEKIEKSQTNVEKESVLFEFNPNVITKKDWLKLGVSEKLATTIRHYLEKGGSFEKVEDLQKIYGFSQKDFGRLKSYVKIPEKVKKQEIIKKIDINAVSVADFVNIKIRNNIATRLVKFRDKLGGFVTLSQLSEVYGIAPFELRILQKHCKIEKEIQKIDLNSTTSKDLSKHPYLRFSDAQAIIRYRNRHGNYTEVENLKSAKILTDKVFEKVKFYLKAEK